MVQDDGNQFSDSLSCLSFLFCPHLSCPLQILPYVFILRSLAEDDDVPSSEQGTSASTKRTSLSQGVSVTSNLEERHIPTVESKLYLDEEEDEDSLENILFQSNQAF